MSLQKRIRENMLDAMKSGSKELLGFLRVISGEFGRVGKDLTDEQVIKVLKKMRSNAVDLGNDYEVTILDMYLPKMLSEHDVEVLISEIICENAYSGMKDMGKVMGAIKQHPNASQIDGKLASGIVKKLLA